MENEESVTSGCESHSEKMTVGNASSEQECSEISGCSGCSVLEKKLKEEQTRCSILRANIHKVSANWFHRKTQLSESDMDVESQATVNLLDETTKINEENDCENASETSTSSRDSTRNGRSKDITKLVNIIAQKSAQLDLSEAHCRDLKKKMREYEKLIDDKEDIIIGLRDQLETYLNDNQKMSVQLNNLASLFQQIEKVDKETVTQPEVPDADSESSVAVPLPSQEEYQEMASSVSRTYIKLRDLVYEKKALVTEIERLNTLNVELQRRVAQQETRLMGVTDALHQTWLVVSDLKEQHSKLHDDELVFKYELKEKREILTKLRKELESSRQQWQIIRQKNLESEEEYASIREMLEERKKTLSEGETVTETDKEEPDEAVCLHPDDTKSFDPPVDLLLEMGLEYGIIGEEAEMTQTVLEVIRGEDVRNCRLEQLEEHCSLLYTKLIASTSRSLALASRLSRLHEQYGSTDDEDAEYPTEGEEQYEEDSGDSDEEDPDEEMPYLTDANQMILMESVLSSPDSEEYDTAYVSETEGIEVLPDTEVQLTDLPSTSSDRGLSVIPEDTAANIEEMNENCDHLSKTLINFLPRKIEYLREENEKLEQSLASLKDEKVSSDLHAKKMEKEKCKLEEEMKILTKEMTIEKLQKRQLEEQLKHLGKCVDELKLKHDAERKGSKVKEQEEKDVEEAKEEEKKTEKESRSDGEKKAESERMKREVDLVKKEMEIRKREKELKKKEEEMERKLQNTEQRNSAREEKAEGVSGLPGVATPNMCEASKPFAVDWIFRFAKREIIPQLVRKQLLSPQKTNSASENRVEEATENGASLTKQESDGLTRSSSEPESFQVASTLFSEGLTAKSEEVAIKKENALLLPVCLQATDHPIICKFKPSKDAVLQVIQVTIPEISNSVPLPTTNDSAAVVDRSSSAATATVTNVGCSNLECSVLVPSSGIPSNVTSTVTLRAKRPVVCVIVFRNNRDEELQIGYTLNTEEAH